MKPFVKYLVFILSLLLLCLIMPEELHQGNTDTKAYLKTDTCYKPDINVASLADTLPSSKEYLAGSQMDSTY